MKINYKKMASVLASTIMLGSTVAFAGAAWPTPLVNSGVEDAAIVIGASAADSDNLAALDLGASLDKSITATTGGTISGDGDKQKIAKGSNKVTLNSNNSLNGNLSYVWGTAITDSDLKTLLADGVFNNKQNSEYKYEQTVKLGDSLLFGHFSDSNYQDKLPTLGFNLASSVVIANYSLKFITNPESTHGSTLADFESKNVKLLGKDYYILRFTNSTDDSTITFLDTATSASLSGEDKKTLTVGDKTYEVSIKFLVDNQVILTVNGVDTEKLSANGVTYGNTYKLADGTYVGIKNINAEDYAGGTKQVDFSLGKGKLEVKSGSNVKINDVDINDLYGEIKLGNANSKRTWNQLNLVWKLSERNFLTAGKELVMPGFEAIKLIMEDTTVPAKEMTKIMPSSDYINLQTTIKDGDVTIPILYLNASGNFTGIGKSATERLATSSTTTLFYGATSTATFENDGFVVSYAGSRDAESYYLDVTSVKSSSVGNVTTIKNRVTGDSYADKKKDDTITLGNIVLTVGDVLVSGDDKNVTFTVNGGSSFNKLYTKSGLKIDLPYNVGNATATANGAISALGFGAYNDSAPDGNNGNQWKLHMTESDKDGSIALGAAFYATIDNAASGSTQYITVLDVTGDQTAYETPKSGSEVWESYVYSDLATKITHDKSDNNQYFANVEYHGGQVYANVYVAAPSVTTSGGSAKVKVVKDSEVSSVSSKNLIVLGGSCINTVAATLLGSTTPLCGADFATKTQAGAGQYLIQTFASPYNSAKIAMLVAGYDAAETTAAALVVKAGSADVTVGKSVVGPTAG